MTLEQRQARYKKGLWAEFIAELFLIIKGYRILARRYKTSFGEIDLVALKGKAIIAIEVKARESFTDALYAVNARSRSRIEKTLSYFLAHNPRYVEKNLRFDVITIKLPFFIRHIDNALRPRA